MEFKCLTRDRLGKVTTNVVRGRDISTVVTNLKKEGFIALKVDKIKSESRLKKSFFSLTSNRVKFKEKLPEVIDSKIQSSNL